MPIKKSFPGNFFLSNNSKHTEQLRVVLEGIIFPSKLHIFVLTLAGVYLRELGKDEMEIWQFHRTSARSFVTELSKKYKYSTMEKISEN